MTPHPSHTSAGPRAKQVRQRRVQAALIAALAALALIAAIVGRGSGKHDQGGVAGTSPPPRPAVEPVRLASAVVGHLSVPEEGAAVAQAGPASAMLIGGRGLGGVPRADVIVLHGAREARHTMLPTALEDATAVRLGRAVYLFGGTTSGGISDQITRVSLSGRPPIEVDKLPHPLSGAAAATVGSSVFVVGGFNGKHASNQILAWRPGHHVRAVGKLPHPLRFPALAALGRNLYIAGGSTPQGASHDVLVFDTVTRKLSVGARLPRPSTGAAAVSFGCCVYVLGGQQEQKGVPSRRIFAVQPGRRHVRPAGRLPVALAGLGAVTQRRRILAIGGRNREGPIASIIELRIQR